MEDLNTIELVQSFVPTVKQTTADWTQAKQTSELKYALKEFLLQYTSDATRDAYRTDFKRLKKFTLEFVGIELKFAEQITERLLLLWLQFMTKNEGLSNNSMRRRLNAVSSFFDYLIKRSATTSKNPVSNITMPKSDVKNETNSLSKREMKQMLDSLRNKYIKAETASEKMRTEIDWMMGLLLFSTGMRANEICELTFEDVTLGFDTAKLRLKVKGGGHHFITLQTTIARKLTAYINKHPNRDNKSFPLFSVNLRIEPLTRQKIYYLIKNTAKSVGIEKEISPHSCRATIATLLHKERTPIGEIQNLLNHKDVSTTMIYVKKSESQTSVTESIDFI